MREDNDVEKRLNEIRSELRSLINKVSSALTDENLTGWSQIRGGFRHEMHDALTTLVNIHKTIG